MNRRTYLTTVGSTLGLLGTAGCAERTPGIRPRNTETPEPTPNVAENVSEDVEAAKPLYFAFRSELRQYYTDARVGITKRGEIGAKITPDADSGDELTRELHEIVDVYADVVGEYEPVSLTVQAGGVRAIVPRAPIQQFAKENLKRDALHETVVITDA